MDVGVGNGYAGGSVDPPWVARRAAATIASRYEGWAIAAKGLAALVHGEALELGRAVFGDDDVDLVTGGGDHVPASNQGTIRELVSPPAVNVEGRQIRERSSSDRPGPATKSSCAADAGVLAPADGVGHDLAVDVDGQRAVDGDHRRLRAITSGEFTMLDRQEGDVLVAVEPVVELAGAGREGGDRDAVELALAALVTLPASVELHQAGR